jgi:diketogulonate reductase-like aldo/keto reductase
MPVTAYSPLGGDHNLLEFDRALAQMGTAHGCTAAAVAVALAWVIRSGKVIAIPESCSPAHAEENAVALSLTLTAQDIQIVGRSLSSTR